MRFLLRRLGLYALAGFLSLTFNFFLPRLMPGDPAAALFGRFQGRLKPEALDALRRAFGLSEDPVWVQYLTYLKELTGQPRGVCRLFSSTSHRGDDVRTGVDFIAGWRERPYRLFRGDGPGHCIGMASR